MRDFKKEEIEKIKQRMVSKKEVPYELKEGYARLILRMQKVLRNPNMFEDSLYDLDKLEECLNAYYNSCQEGKKGIVYTRHKHLFAAFRIPTPSGRLLEEIEEMDQQGEEQYWPDNNDRLAEIFERASTSMYSSVTKGTEDFGRKFLYQFLIMTKSSQSTDTQNPTTQNSITKDSTTLDDGIQNSTTDNQLSQTQLAEFRLMVQRVSNLTIEEIHALGADEAIIKFLAAADSFDLNLGE